MNKIKIIISCLLSLFVIFSVIPLSSQAHAYNYVNSQYLAINPYYLFNFDTQINSSYYSYVVELNYDSVIYQFYCLSHSSSYALLYDDRPSSGSDYQKYILQLHSKNDILVSYLSNGTWVPITFVSANLLPSSIIYSYSVDHTGEHYLKLKFNSKPDVVGSIPAYAWSSNPANVTFYFPDPKEYVPDIITAAVILGVQNSGGSGSGSGSVDTTNIINAIIQARESILDTVEDGDDYIQSMLIFMAEILYGDLSGNDNDPSVDDILDSGAINILDYYFKDYFNQLYNRYKNENNQIVNAIWQALNTGNAVNASDNVAAINALKAAIRDEIANSGQLSYIEYISYIVDYLDVFYMALYNQNTEILQKVDRLLTITSSNFATITNRIQQSEDNIINGINDAGENTGSPDLSHTGLDSALSQGSGWAAQILHASSIIDQATQDVENFLVSGSSVLNSILTAFPIFGVILSFVLVFFLVRKVIGR